ncbi:hypothetical protein YB2330_002189 [Saitoella coloradoensis]
MPPKSQQNWTLRLKSSYKTVFISIAPSTTLKKLKAELAVALAQTSEAVDENSLKLALPKDDRCTRWNEISEKESTKLDAVEGLSDMCVIGYAVGDDRFTAELPVEPEDEEEPDEEEQ